VTTEELALVNLVEQLENLVTWLKVATTVFSAIAVPLVIMLVNQWYMTKRLFELHTTEVDRSGFGTVGMRDAIKKLHKTYDSLRASVDSQEETCQRCLECIQQLEIINGNNGDTHG
jgi:hypothetical protein